jgi:tetratricopeptide (TPR) repeat protein
VSGDAFYYLRGNPSAALAEWRQVLRLRPDYLTVLNQTAWLLATNPDASIRNGVEAVELAQRAVRLSGGREPDVLGTLAAAYAEAGRFSEAVETSHRAVAQATQQQTEPLAKTLKARIELYEKRIPFRIAALQPLPGPLNCRVSLPNCGSKVSLASGVPYENLQCSAYG